MFDRPLLQLAAYRSAVFELQWMGAGQLYRASDPPTATGGGIERILAVTLIDQHTDTLLQIKFALCLCNRVDQQSLEPREARFIRTAFARQIVELAAMVESEDMQVIPYRTRHTHAMQMGEFFVAVGALQLFAVGKEVIQFCATRHGGCAAVPRHHHRTAGIGVGATALDPFIPQPAVEK